MWFKLIRDHWAMALTVITATGFGILFIQALRLAHGVPRAAAMMLVGDNLLSAVVYLFVSYMPFVLIGTLMWCVFGALTDMGAIFGFKARTLFWISFAIAGLLLIIAPVYQLVVGLVFVVIVAIQTMLVRFASPTISRWAEAARIRLHLTSRGASASSGQSRAESSERFTRAMTIVTLVILPLVFILTSNSAWLPSEIIKLDGAADLEGVYVVRASEGWVTVMHEDDGAFEVLRDSQIEARVYCSLNESTLEPAWLSLLAISPYPAQPFCS